VSLIALLELLPLLIVTVVVLSIAILGAMIRPDAGRFVRWGYEALALGSIAALILTWLEDTGSWWRLAGAAALAIVETTRWAFGAARGTSRA